MVYVTMREFIDKENTLVGIHASGLLINAEHSLKMGYYIRGSYILMRWLYGFDFGNGLDDIGIGSVYQHDTLTMPINHVAHCPRRHVKHFHGIYVKLDVSESFIMRMNFVCVMYSSLF